MLYTTLFMWPVEVFGWEVFMAAAMEDPERFHEQVLKPFAIHSREIVEEITQGSESPVIFVHDDLCDARGPVFRPNWYESFIFPHYADILAPTRDAGRRVVLVADGNLSMLLPRLLKLGFDGLMFESPATPLDAVLTTFARPDHLLIGGIETAKLTMGSPAEIADMVHSVSKQTAGRPGFALASGGGLHGNIPMPNLEAYFDARAEIGVTPHDWRTICRA
jgi:uroporphyrinogen-III decarboxylase